MAPCCNFHYLSINVLASIEMGARGGVWLLDVVLIALSNENILIPLGTTVLKCSGTMTGSVRLIMQILAVLTKI